VSKLLEAGHGVRVLTRSTGRAERYEWSDRAGVHGDVLDPDTLAPAFDRCYAAYYVAYSIGTDGDFTATEATARSTP
jgi:uncharacterized protein YbjT (DUF2867 family)